jgi:hypothetical protein
MSQRELLLMLAHAQMCAACRDRLAANPSAVFSGHFLTAAERETLAKLPPEAFVTPEALARAAGVAMGQLEEYRDHPVTRLRHL